MFDPINDPNGRALKARTQSVYDQEQQSLQEGPQDAFTVMNMQGNQRNAMSPMAPWLQALKEEAGGRDIKLSGGASPEGSDQLTGLGVQPGQPQSLKALKGLLTAKNRPTTPVPYGS